MKVLILALALLATPAMANGDDAAERSRALANRFQSELMTALQTAVAQKGVAGAVGACTVIAPEVAARLSAESGAVVRRTAIRVRNPAARPDAHESVVLKDMAAAPMQDGKPREISGWVGEDEAARYRYMRAIPTGGLCLSCHGADIAPDVAAAIAAAYPDDAATGFAQGELRGAFSISWTRGALAR